MFSRGRPVTAAAARDAPETLEQWTGDFRITAEYAVAAGRLEAIYRLENPGPHPLPCGFGAHPYFQRSLGFAFNVEQFVVDLPLAVLVHVNEGVTSLDLVSRGAHGELMTVNKMC